jgi:probable rRNA maturation factor
MSPPRPDAINVQFTVEDGVNAEWDEERVGALVRAIIARELVEGSTVLSAAATADETPNDRTRATPPAEGGMPNDRTRPPAPDVGGASRKTFSLPHHPGPNEEKRAQQSITIALHLVSDDRIRQLNAAHRGQDTHTDVLSFPLQAGDEFVVPPGEPTNLGDVVISYPRATQQAMEFGHSTDREVAYLVAHGVLHILGYDHEVEPEKTRMREREEEALQPLGFTR